MGRICDTDLLNITYIIEHILALMHLFTGLTRVYYWWNALMGMGRRPTNTYFHLSVCSANTVGVCTASPFFMSPEWFSPEKQSALLVVAVRGTQWQRMGHLSVPSKPCTAKHLSGLHFDSANLELSWRYFTTLEAWWPLYMFENPLWWKAFWNIFLENFRN